MAVTASSFSLAQESGDRPIKYVRGRICGIDWAGSRVTIQWFYSTDKLADDKMTFIIPDDVKVYTDREKIFKNVRSAGVVDLIVGDRVIIGYRDGKNNRGLEAVTIRVLEQDRPIPS